MTSRPSSAPWPPRCASAGRRTVSPTCSSPPTTASPSAISKTAILTTASATRSAGCSPKSYPYPKERYEVSFQSRLGREQWLKPYTDVRLEELAKSGVRKVDVMCPGFSVDCLETLDEIGREARDIFLAAGGEQFRFIPCLNDRPDQIELFLGLIRRNLADWVESKADWDDERALKTAAESKALAAAMAAEESERVKN